VVHRKKYRNVIFNTNAFTDLPPEVRMSRFRVLQVALHNGVRHRGAGQVKVELQGVSNEIQIESKPMSGTTKRVRVPVESKYEAQQGNRVDAVDGFVR